VNDEASATGFQHWPPPHSSAQPQPGPYSPPAAGHAPYYYLPGSQAPYGQQPPKQRTGRIVWIVVGVVVGVAVAILGLFVALGIWYNSTLPGSLGEDPHMDARYAECEAGNMGACDDLYNGSAVASELEDFGATCGGRLDSWATSNCRDLNL
jgi:hypothetical protein